MRILPAAFATTLAATVIAATAALAAPALSPAAKTALLAALDDEYKAHATYAVTMDAFGHVRPFSRIINAEARHIDMVKSLLTKYGVEIPANPYTGSNSPAKPASLLDACKTGVAAEVDNAKLYDNNILPAVANYPDISSVMKQLRDASQNNHLAAFQRCVDRGGTMGKGGGHGGGMGRGQGGHGMGKGMGGGQGGGMGPGMGGKM